MSIRFFQITVLSLIVGLQVVSADEDIPQLVTGIVFSMDAMNELRISQQYIPMGEALPIQLQVLQWGLRPTTVGIKLLWNGKSIDVDTKHLAEIQHIQLDTLRIEDGISERYVEFEFGDAIGQRGAFMTARLEFTKGKYESMHVVVPATQDDAKAEGGRRLYAIGIRRMAGQQFYTLGKEKKAFASLKEVIELYNPVASQKSSDIKMPALSESSENQKTAPNPNQSRDNPKLEKQDSDKDKDPSLPEATTRYSKAPTSNESE